MKCSKFSIGKLQTKAKIDFEQVNKYQRLLSKKEMIILEKVIKSLFWSAYIECDASGPITHSKNMTDKWYNCYSEGWWNGYWLWKATSIFTSKKIIFVESRRVNSHG